MKSYVHSAVSLLLIYFGTLPMAYSQKKNFTYEQLFQGAVSKVSQPLPVIKNWIDEEHYLEQSKQEETGALLYYKVAARTGQKEPWKEPETDESSVLNTLTSFLTEAINKTLSPDKKWVAYTKADHNLYVTELTSRRERQLTQDGSEQILNGYASWVYYEEILGRSSRYKAFWWSPDSKQLAFMRFDESLVSVFPIYWSDGQQGRLESQRYPKAGTPNPKVQIGILQVSQPSSVTWADFSPQQDQYFGSLQWTPRGELWVPWMNRNQDSLVIYSVSLLKGSKQIIYQEHQPTWVDLDELNRIEFVGPGEEFILKSDRDGWENLYLYDRSGKLKNAITTGSFWGTSVLKIDAQKRWLYFRSRHESSLRFDLYRVRLDGTGLTRLSFGAYTHDQVWLSPGGKYFITQYSNINTPPA
ncbi:MAG: DPP IV N-terminal domain-containing protein, partial [Chitinophagaceae bacterium]